MTSDTPNADVSVLVVSWNTCALTRACLDSISGSVSDGTPVATIVVDNGSTDGSLEMLQARPDVELVANDCNLGYAAAVNQGYLRSSGALVLLQNSDVELPSGSVQALVSFLHARPEVAAVGPLYLNPDGSFQQHHYRLPTLPALMASASAPLRHIPPFARSFRRYRMLDESFSAPRTVEQPSASCLLLRRDVLPAGYLLDEEFPIYFNDVELAHRLRSNGGQLWMTPESKVFHVHGASTSQLGSNLRPQHLASLVRYLRRTRSPLAVLLFRAVVLGHVAGLRIVRGRQAAPPIREVLRALRGELGPLPQAPLRATTVSAS